MSGGEPDADAFDDAAWQDRWERTHRLYMPGRAAMTSTVMDVLDAAGADGPFNLLDLAGGPGSMSLVATDRFPGVHSTLLDVEPVLLDLAERPSARPLNDRVTTVAAGLATPSWMEAAGGPFDAVVVVMALHWFGP